MAPEAEEKRTRDRTVAVNRKARHEYDWLETVEAGIVLQGTEIKAIREGAVSLVDAYCKIKKGEVFLENCQISPYSHGNIHNHPIRRPRKLLLNRGEIDRLTGKVQEKGLTLIPTRLYLLSGRAKIEVALARGKKTHDKRETIKARDMKRDLDRTMRESEKRR